MMFLGGGGGGLPIALLDTCTSTISRLGIVFKNERRQLNVKIVQFR